MFLTEGCLFHISLTVGECVSDRGVFTEHLLPLTRG